MAKSVKIILEWDTMTPKEVPIVFLHDNYKKYQNRRISRNKIKIENK